LPWQVPCNAYAVTWFAENPRSLELWFRTAEFRKSRLVDYGDSQLASLIEFASGVLSREEVGGLFTDAARDLAAKATDGFGSFLT
jgi:hypothetical protein